MAEQLAQMAGPGAQIFVDGFRGGRLPPKDQIQQIRFRTNSYAAEYHDAGMVRVEVITKPGMGDWRSRVNFGFRDESMNAVNAFADERAPEQVRRGQLNSQGPDRQRQDQRQLLGRGQRRLRFADHRGDRSGGRGPRAGTPAQRRRQRHHPASSRRSAPATPSAPSTSGAPRTAVTSASATSICPSAPTAPTPSPTRCGCATPA